MFIRNSFYLRWSPASHLPLLLSFYAFPTWLVARTHSPRKRGLNGNSATPAMFVSDIFNPLTTGSGYPCLFQTTTITTRPSTALHGRTRYWICCFAECEPTWVWGATAHHMSFWTGDDPGVSCEMGVWSCPSPPCSRRRNRDQVGDGTLPSFLQGMKASHSQIFLLSAGFSYRYTSLTKTGCPGRGGQIVTQVDVHH